MDARIKLPLYVFEETDLTIFSSQQKLIDYGYEFQDLKRGEYHCYDSLGYEVILDLYGIGKFERLILERGDFAPDHFRFELIDRLQRTGEIVAIDIDDTELLKGIQAKYDMF